MVSTTDFRFHQIGGVEVLLTVKAFFQVSSSARSDGPSARPVRGTATMFFSKVRKSSTDSNALKRKRKRVVCYHAAAVQPCLIPNACYYLSFVSDIALGAL